MKCITFDKGAQGALPKHIKDKMKIDKFCARTCGLSSGYCEKAKYDLCSDLREFKKSL